MKISGRKRGIFSLVAGPTEAVLCKIIPTTNALPTVEIIAHFPGDPAAAATYSGLGDSLAGRRGALSASLPLNLFETVTLNLPLSNEEAIARVLPFYLGKTIDRPLNDFVYDWQVVKRQKDSVRIAVFLLPALIERGLKTALTGAGVKLVNIEPGVFSAFAFLGTMGRLPPGKTVLTAIVYNNFISQGVYEAGVLRLVRVVKLATPDAPFEVLENTDENQPTTTGAGDDILSAFSLSASPEPEMAVPVMENTEPQNNPWKIYLEQLNLEIIRGRDYYSAIMKGAPIERLILAGEGDFIEALSVSVSRHNEMDTETLLNGTPGRKKRLANALAIGAAIDHDIGLERINLVPAEPLAQKFKKLPVLIITTTAIILFTFLGANYLDLERKSHNATALLASLKTKEKAVMIISASRGNLARQIRELNLKQKDLKEQLLPLKSPMLKKRHYAAILKIISQTMPPQVRCDRIDFNGAGVEIHGQAVNHETIELMSNRLRNLPQVTDFSLNDIDRTDNPQAPLTFKAAFSLSPDKDRTKK